MERKENQIANRSDEYGILINGLPPHIVEEQEAQYKPRIVTLTPGQFLILIVEVLESNDK